MPPPIHLVIILLASAALAGRPEVMQIVAGEQQRVHNAVEYPLMGDNEQIPEIPKSSDGFNNIPSRQEPDSPAEINPTMTPPSVQCGEEVDGTLVQNGTISALAIQTI